MQYIMCISFIAFRYHLKQYDQLKWMWKALKNILIVNHNFVITIGLPYCYFIPFKVILEQTISTKCWDILHMFYWFVCTKTKVTTTCTTSEQQSSYNQNNFIILMKLNNNNVGIEENFQVSSFTAFRLNNLCPRTSVTLP